MLPLAPGQQISGDEQARRLKQASRDALDVFGKVRESLQFMTGTGEAAGSGAVYLNMGHCYYSRDEFDRAVECVRAFIFLI
jgi:RNA polymerase-associated protein CTR9